MLGGAAPTVPVSQCEKPRVPPRLKNCRTHIRLHRQRAAPHENTCQPRRGGVCARHGARLPADVPAAGRPPLSTPLTQQREQLPICLPAHVCALETDQFGARFSASKTHAVAQRRPRRHKDLPTMRYFRLNRQANCVKRTTFPLPTKTFRSILRY